MQIIWCDVVYLIIRISYWSKVNETLINSYNANSYEEDKWIISIDKNEDNKEFLSFVAILRIIIYCEYTGKFIDMMICLINIDYTL